MLLTFSVELCSLCDEAAVVWVVIPPFLLLTELLTNSHISGQRFSNLAASKKAPLMRVTGLQKVLGSPCCQAESNSQLLAYIFFAIANSVSIIIAIGTRYFFFNPMELI